MRKFIVATAVTISLLPAFASFAALFVFAYLGIFQRSETFGNAAIFSGFVALPITCGFAALTIFIMTEAGS